MTPIVPPGANMIYKKPVDWDEEANGPCDDLHVIKCDGFINTFWKPNADELKTLNEGGNVLIVVVGNQLPAIAVSVASVKRTPFRSE